MEFIPRVTPAWAKPLHLAPYVEALEKAPGSSLRLAFSAPPQHSKSSCATSAFVYWGLRFPHLRNAYATYSSQKAERVSRGAQMIASSAGLQLETANLDIWRTRQGGQTLWTSVGGALTGEPIDGVLVIDDSIKDRKEAESVTVRQNQKDWYHSVAETRLHLGSSVIVMMTRWHEDDLLGYLVKSCGFTHINLKAIADTDCPPGDERQPGEALWPLKHPIHTLEEKRRNSPWNFAAMYQGEPRPRGDTLFGPASYYSYLPESGFRVINGADLAYSQKKRSKFSVLVKVYAVPPRRGIAPTDPDKPYLDWEFFIVEAHRKQVAPPEFGLVLKSAARSGSIHMYGTGVEEGAASFFREAGIRIEVMDTGGRDKYQRSLKTSELWNAGRIHIPEDVEANPWVDDYRAEMNAFTGVNDAFSDQVDATVSAIDAAIAGRGGGFELPRRSGGGRWA